ncbi:hypothetical protein H0H92_009147 [Tricholoma furcatifolium]|nr:hypothetical protein H0H92_009147 [Tricholoma furcatifolium]
MGQRHQAFLIAKIVPRGETAAKYRCVVANHHQWCYGRGPLQAARRFLTLVKKQEHAQIIREELRALDGKYGRWQQHPPVPAIAAPFSWFLLTTSFNVNFNPSDNDPIPAKAHTNLDANMGSTDGDNNDGITVIDITEPENPAYCFVNEDRPLSATEYVRGYYPESETDEDSELEGLVSHAIAALKNERMVTPQMLSEAWPDEYKVVQGDLEQKEPNSEPVDLTKPVASLSDLMLGPAVKRAIEAESTDDIEQLLWLPDKAHHVLSILKARETLPDSALSLLTKAMDHVGNGNFDFANFPLTGSQILSICIQLHDVHALDLSHNPHVTIDTIQSLLESLPMLNRLVLLDTSVTDEALCSLLHTHPKLFYNLEAFVHPLFLYADIASVKERRYPNSFAIVKSVTDYHRVNTGSLPFFSPSLVVQAVLDVMKSLTIISNGISVEAQAAVSSTIRKPSETWTTRTVPLIALDSYEGAIDGEGWIFAVNLRDRVGKYAFIRTSPVPKKQEETGGKGMGEKEDNLQEEGEQGSTSKTVEDSVTDLLDFDGFLQEMTKEGRSPAPAATVEALRDFFKNNDVANRSMYRPTDKREYRAMYPCQMMNAAEANQFIQYLRYEVPTYAKWFS